MKKILTLAVFALAASLSAQVSNPAPLTAQFTNVALQSPTGGTTFYVGVSGGTTTSSGSTLRWIAPRACTLASVSYGNVVNGTVDTAADAFTLKVYDKTTSTALTDSSGTLTAQTGSQQSAVISTSDAIAAGDSIIVQIVAPASFTVSPTNMYWAANITCN